MIKIEYWNSKDILDCHYEGSYQNRFWLDVDIAKPEYIVNREQFEDSYGDKHNIFLKWEKQYSFELHCIETVTDMLSMITLHDNVWITFDTGYSCKVKDFTTNIEWTSMQSIAKVNCTFITKSYTVNGAGASNC
jgi:hypothetical protein